MPRNILNVARSMGCALLRPASGFVASTSDQLASENLAEIQMRFDTFRETGELALPKDLGHLRPEGYASGLTSLIPGFIMWNPSIRKSIQIPSFLACVIKEKVSWLDLSALIHIAGVEHRHDSELVVVPLYQSDGSYVLIEVYSLHTRSWMYSLISSKA
ncbi:hypothetical protein Cgig2_021878 [Carnegiea gigantea]|uniref:Uncharacterized protein n=1 Tax=Carnegiea gigantea TaxID=171969 RepID=A0A9Q1GWP3_9CARY|nr:hypothetical protein Cgig2_021878 [Carnegiea gigantea]